MTNGTGCTRLLGQFGNVGNPLSTACDVIYHNAANDWMRVLSDPLTLYRAVAVIFHIPMFTVRREASVYKGLWSGVREKCSPFYNRVWYCHRNRGVGRG